MAEALWINRITGSGTEAPEQLLANPKNFRRHPSHQSAALKGVLTQVGWVQDVIVNQRTGFLVDGHLRVELAMREGQTEIPVKYVDLSPEDEALVLATLDPISAMATADADALEALLEDVKTQDASLLAMLDDLRDEHGIGLGAGEGLTDADDVPEPPAEPITKPGDLWLLGDHRLLCGDSTKADDVARLMDGERAVLMATDPPYLVDYKGGQHPASKSNKGAANKDKDWSESYNEVEIGDIAPFLDGFLKAALSVALIDNPAIYQWHADRRRIPTEQAWLNNGILMHQSIIWVKARPVLTHSHFMWQSEPCLYGWVAGKQPSKRPPASARNVWEIDQKGDSDGIHPTQKPTEIFLRPIDYHTDPGDLIYEPFAGSGTAIIASEMLSRRCCAMELSPTYCDVIVRRWEQFTDNQASLERREDAA